MDLQLDIVDFHTHILPGVDHGCKSVEMAKAQLKLAQAAGVKRVVLTPHFYPHIDSLDDFLQKRDSAYEQLLEAIGDAEEYPDIRLGCEILICEGISNMANINMLCVRGTKTLLLELPFSDFSKRYVDDVSNLISAGYNVVMAHADRYSPRSIEELIAVGATLQINADAMSGLFVPSVIRHWLESGCAVALGSDIHLIDKFAYKRFDKARKIILKKYDKAVAPSDEIWNSSLK